MAAFAHEDVPGPAGGRCRKNLKGDSLVTKGLAKIGKGMVRRFTCSQHEKGRRACADQRHQVIDLKLVQILWWLPAMRLPCMKKKASGVTFPGNPEAAIPVSVNELKVAAVAKGSDIDHAPSAVFRYGTRVVILVEMALQVEEGQRADGNEHR